MRRSGRGVAVVALIASALGTTGCPGLLSDDYEKIPARVDAGFLAAGDTGGRTTVGSGGAPGDVPDATRAASGGRLDGSGGHPPFEASVPDAAPREDAGPCSACGPTKTCCNGTCVDLERDPRHCRTCGSGCPGTLCSNATCTNECALGFVDCNLNVADGCEVDASRDPGHCGNCATACAFEQRCELGVCRCPEHTADCDGLATNGCEADLGSDRTNCGQCHEVCGANTVCSAGKCDCAPGFGDCNGNPGDGCEVSLTESAACGSCKLDCGLHSVCVSAGTCGCAPGYQDCDPLVPGCETPSNDPRHCGTCALSCAAPTPSCNGTACVAGCGSLSLCGGSCVDSSTSPLHCGACDKPVGVHRVCVAGKPACAAGFADCDANPDDCEVDSRSDAANCGGCGKACKPGAICSGGVCACSSATPEDCGTACRECCLPAQCSDGNACTTDLCTAAGRCQSGTECAGAGHCCAGQGCYECCNDADCLAGLVCSGNTCQKPACNPPLVLCGSTCADVATDPVNCNGCGNVCGKGRGCSGGDCAPDWVPLSAPPPGFVGREKAAYAAFGSRVFVFGGANAAGQGLGDGAFYDTATDLWGTVGASNAPSPRVLATAVWTGTYVVVWGGGSADGRMDYADGKRWNPTTNGWLPMTMAGAPNGRRAAYGFWTGSRVIIWEGVDKGNKVLPGTFLYDPQNDSWSRGASKDEPQPLSGATVGFTGSLLVVSGGQPDGKGTSRHTYVYSPAQNLWSRGADGPSDHYDAFGTWDGLALLAWSGSTLGTDGKRYDPASDAWTDVSAGTLAGRRTPYREAGFSASTTTGVTLVLGGYGAGNAPLMNGGLYNGVTNSWSSVATWPDGAAHLWGVGVLAGTEFVVWGGRSGIGPGLTTLGSRIRP